MTANTEWYGTERVSFSSTFYTYTIILSSHLLMSCARQHVNLSTEWVCSHTQAQAGNSTFVSARSGKLHLLKSPDDKMRNYEL